MKELNLACSFRYFVRFAFLLCPERNLLSCEVNNQSNGSNKKSMLNIKVNNKDTEMMLAFYSVNTGWTTKL